MFNLGVVRVILEGRANRKARGKALQRDGGRETVSRPREIECQVCDNSMTWQKEGGDCRGRFVGTRRDDILI